MTAFDPEATPALRVSGLGVTYGDKVAVRDVSFSVARGEIVALVGPNGAGKSSTIRAIAGITEHRGEVFVGSFPAGSRDAKMRLRLAPQTTAFTPGLTVAQNLLFVEQLLGAGRWTASDAASLMGLQGCMDVRAERLSGGLARRLHVAAALVGDSELLVLDEPSVGMDLESRQWLRRSVRDVAAAGVGVLYVSHQFDEVEAVANRVVLLSGGGVLLDAPPGEYRRRLDYVVVQVRGEGLSDIALPESAYDVEAVATQLAFSLPRSAVAASLAEFLHGGLGRDVDLEVRPPSLEDAVWGLLDDAPRQVSSV